MPSPSPLERLAAWPAWHAWWLHLLVLAVLWGALHLGTLSWGLPAERSLAADAVPINLGDTPMDFMRQDAFKYPPFQYLLWQWFGPPGPPPGADDATRLSTISHRLWWYRFSVAFLSLLTTFAAYWVGRRFLDLGSWSLLPAVLFVANPVSLYYSHTTNMDQPFTCWLMLSLLPFAYANFSRPSALPSGPVSRRERRQRQRAHAAPEAGAAPAIPRRWLWGNVLFAVAMALSFCSKDQVYGIYPLPLAAYLVWRYRCRDPLSRLALQAVLWVVPFFLTMAIVYQAAGGFSVFQMHVDWLLHSARTGFEQVGTGPLERLKLFWLALKSVAAALEWPLTFALLGTIGLAAAGRQALWRDPRFRFVSIATALAWVSYVLLFVQSTRYTFERYYLIFIVAAGWLLARGLQLIVRQRPRVPGRTLALLVTALTIALGIQLLHILTHDSRIMAAPTLASHLDDPASPPAIGLDAMSFGHIYHFDPRGTRQKRVVRDWSTSRLPYSPLPIRGVLLDPLFLDLNHPDWIIGYATGSNELALLERSGYERVDTLTSPPGRLWHWYSIGSPVITLHRLKQFVPPDLDTLRARPFADQALILMAAFDGRDVSILERFGSYVGDFDVAALADCYTSGAQIEWLAVAYDFNDRLVSAEKAFRFLMTHYGRESPSFERNWLLYCQRRGVKP